MTIIIKTKDEVAAMRRAGSIVAMILRTMAEEMKSGMETKELDAIAVRTGERVVGQD